MKISLPSSIAPEPSNRAPGCHRWTCSRRPARACRRHRGRRTRLPRVDEERQAIAVEVEDDRVDCPAADNGCEVGNNVVLLRSTRDVVRRIRRCPDLLIDEGVRHNADERGEGNRRAGCAESLAADIAPTAATGRSRSADSAELNGSASSKVMMPLVMECDLTVWPPIVSVESVPSEAWHVGRRERRAAQAELVDGRGNCVVSGLTEQRFVVLQSAQKMVAVRSCEKVGNCVAAGRACRSRSR